MNIYEDGINSPWNYGVGLASGLRIPISYNCTFEIGYKGMFGLKNISKINYQNPELVSLYSRLRGINISILKSLNKKNDFLSYNKWLQTFYIKSLKRIFLCWQTTLLYNTKKQHHLE